MGQFPDGFDSCGLKGCDIEFCLVLLEIVAVGVVGFVGLLQGLVLCIDVMHVWWEFLWVGVFICRSI